MRLLDTYSQSGEASKNNAVVAFIRDMLKNMTRSGCGKRWSPETKDLLSLLWTRGNHTAVELFLYKLKLPSASTVLRHVKEQQRVVELGYHPEGFAYVANFYSNFMRTHHIPRGSILFMLAEDETAISGGLSYCLRTGRLFGHCGKKGEGHKCDCVGIPVDGDAPDAFLTLKSKCEEYQIARCGSGVSLSSNCLQSVPLLTTRCCRQI